jgi:membrane associated rhomboid family serine protease
VVVQLIARFETTFRTHTEPFTDLFSLDVSRVLQGQVWRLVTHAFLHSTTDFWHIFGNMLFLWWFGRQIEERLGSREFLTFYLTAALVAGLAFFGATLVGFHKMSSYAVGASGAVMAVLMLSALYYPAQIIYVFYIIPVPIWLVIAYLIGRDAFALLGRAETGIGTSAHLGGALFGFLYYRYEWRLSDWIPEWLTVWNTADAQRGRARLRIYNPDEEPAPVPPAPSRIDDEQLEAKVDAILAKVSRVGMAGLTESEKETLMRASETIRKKGI